MNIWLDDVREAPAGWKHLTDAWSVIYYLSEFGEEIEELSLDHDLGDDERHGTGYTVMQWLEEQVHIDNDFPVPKINFHSANPVGLLNMKRSLDAIMRIKLS